MFGDQPDGCYWPIHICLIQPSLGEFFNEARIDFVLSQTQVDRVMAFSLPLQVQYPIPPFLIDRINPITPFLAELPQL